LIQVNAACRSAPKAAQQGHPAAGRELIDELAARGILILTRSMRGAAEDAPGAYKDVETVALATERAGLARRVASLAPRICVKG